MVVTVAVMYSVVTLLLLWILSDTDSAQSIHNNPAYLTTLDCKPGLVKIRTKSNGCCEELFYQSYLETLGYIVGPKQMLCNTVASETAVAFSTFVDHNALIDIGSGLCHPMVALSSNIDRNNSLSNHICKGLNINVNPGDTSRSQTFSHLFYKKTKMFQRLQTYCDETNIYRKPSLNCDFLPATFHMNDESQRIAFFNQFDCKTESSLQQTWLLKQNKHLGSGIQLISDVVIMHYLFITDISELRRTKCGQNRPDLFAMDTAQFTESHSTEMKVYRSAVVAQQWISNVLLINRSKFHIRTFWMVASGDNPFLVLFMGGFVSTTEEIYDPNNVTLAMVISNRAFLKRTQKDTSRFGSENEPDWMWPFHRLQSYIIDHKSEYPFNQLSENELHDWVQSSMIPQHCRIAETLFRAAKYEFEYKYPKTGALYEGMSDFFTKNSSRDSFWNLEFDFSAMDTIIDDNFEVKLMEFQKKPSIKWAIPYCYPNFKDTNGQFQNMWGQFSWQIKYREWACHFLKDMIGEAMDIAMELAAAKKEGKSVTHLDSIKSAVPAIFE